LTSNPKAKVVAFDVVRYLYTSAALNSIYQLYPDRDILLITGNSLSLYHLSPLSPCCLSLSHTLPVPGDSTQSVPRSAKYFKSSCNVIFIDGGHTYDIAYADLINMRALANETYHTVVIDDGTMPGVRKAVIDVASEGILKTIREVVTNQTLCLRSREVSSGVDKGKDVLYRDENCYYDLDSDSIQSSMIIGKYVF
jgi:hypothetical protein